MVYMAIGSMFIIQEFNKDFEGGKEQYKGVKGYLKKYFVANLRDFKANNWF